MMNISPTPVPAHVPVAILRSFVCLHLRSRSVSRSRSVPIWLPFRPLANVVRAVARRAHKSAEKHWRVVRKIIAYLNKTKENLGLVYVKDGGRKLSVYVDVNYTNKDNGRCSVSGVAVMVGGI